VNSELISTGCTVLALVMTALNAWGRTQVRSEVLQLRLHISEHYVTNKELEQIIQRLEKLVERLERRIEERGIAK
jgi:hypothetical protein